MFSILNSKISFKFQKTFLTPKSKTRVGNVNMSDLSITRILENLISENESLTSSDLKIMKILIIMKMEFYQAIGYYCLGMAAEESGEYGEAVGYFRQSKQCLANSDKQSEKMGKEQRAEVINSMLYARDVIEGKLSSAEKDNEFIYHMLLKENLPPPETLSRPMVKATAWDPISEPELFCDVVPDEAFISSSNYSEKTDAVWRELSDEISIKNDELLKCQDALKAAGIDFE